jgi:hypothetical protein
LFGYDLKREQVSGGIKVSTRACNQKWGIPLPVPELVVWKVLNKLVGGGLAREVKWGLQEIILGAWVGTLAQ